MLYSVNGPNNFEESPELIINCQIHIDISKLLVISDHIDDPPPSMSGWKLFAVIIVGCIGVGVCAMVGFIIFIKKQEDSRKRFY